MEMKLSSLQCPAQNNGADKKDVLGVAMLLRLKPR